MKEAKYLKDTAAAVLTINVGSSSIRFAFFTGGTPPVRGWSGHMERIGSAGTVLSFKDAVGIPGPNPSHRAHRRR